jgi:hypothetical protein
VQSTLVGVGVRVRVVEAGGTYGVDPSGESNGFNVVPGVLDHFLYTLEPTPLPAVYEAGDGIAVTIRAEDAYDNLLTGYTQGVAVSDTTGTISEGAPGSGDTVITFTNGIYNVGGAANLFVTRAQGNVEITVQDGAVVGVSGQFTVEPAVLASFGVRATGWVPIGGPTTCTGTCWRAGRTCSTTRRS